MRIGELAQKVGCQVETIRFYEAKQLLPPAVRSPSNNRLYDERHLKRMRFIRNCRMLNMSLDDIRVLISISENGDRGAETAHEIVQKHLDAIDQQMTLLKNLKIELENLQCRCHGHNHEGECGLMSGLREGAF